MIHVPPDMIDHFRRRVIQDAVTEATACHWERRAGYFERCLIQPGDYTGKLTAAEIEESNRRIESIIDACLNKARVIRLEGLS